MKADHKGWCFVDFEYDEFYESHMSIRFEYQGKVYRISCEDDQALYDDETNEVLWHFNSEEEFYSGVVFGKPVKDVIDNSFMMGMF